MKPAFAFAYFASSVLGGGALVQWLASRAGGDPGVVAWLVFMSGALALVVRDAVGLMAEAWEEARRSQ